MFKFLTSTIVAKVVMALTGLVLVGFLFAHAIGNLQFFLGSDAYNAYASFLQEPLGKAEFLWAMRAGLLLCLILHIISAVYLRLYNNAAKPIHYRVKNYVKSKLTARIMMWTGILIFTGLTFHILHFTTGTVTFNDGYDNYEIISTGEYAVLVDGNESCQTAKCSTVRKIDCAKKCDSMKKCENQTCCQAGNRPCQTSGTECSNQASCCQTNLQTNLAANTPHCEAEIGCCGSSKSDCNSKEKCCQIKSSKIACIGSNQSDCNDNISLLPVVKERHDVHAMVVAEFSSVWVALLYIVFVSLVGFHLNHAIQSAFHTLGIQGPKFTPIMRVASIGLAFILVVLFCAVPLGVVAFNLLNWFGIDICFFNLC